MPALLLLTLLIGSVLLGGMPPLILPNNQRRSLQWMFPCSGGYLLALTLLHVLPEALLPYAAWKAPCLLAGFMVQLLLDLLGKGISHGHLCPTPNHAPQATKGLLLWLALLGHALLDGVLLTHTGTPTVCHGHNHNHLLMGIILHKIPAAFALIATLSSLGYPRQRLVVALLGFAMASPLGWLGSHYLQQAYASLCWEGLWAVAAGSLLHIATTLFAEGVTPDNHHLSFRHILWVGIGALLAFAAEVLG